MKNLWQQIKSRVAIKTTLFLVLILFVTIFFSNNFETWEAFLYSFILLIISGGGQYYNQEKKFKNL